jgi:hypothetical protein
VFFIVPIPRIRRRQAPARVAPPPPQFALLPTTQDGETALFTDSRAGFSHALPGWPQASAVTSGPGEPPADALVQFWDFPMWVRYRLERMTGPAPSAMHFAIDWASRYVVSRTRAPVKAEPARPERIAKWSVDAAAVASYPLTQPDLYGADHEDLTVLVRHGMILTVTRRHSGAAQDWVRHASFRAAVESTMLWDPQRFKYAARIWPPSSFLEPMLVPVLSPARQQVLPALTAELALIAPGEGEALGKVLETMMRAEDPPWEGLSPAAREHWSGQLRAAMSTPSLAELVQRGFAEVQTVHDLRGFALMTGSALSGSPV